MAGLPFKVVWDTEMAKTPKGKMPYIEDGEKVIADSGIIIDYLKATYGDVLDAHLSPKEKAVTLALPAFWMSICTGRSFTSGGLPRRDGRPPKLNIFGGFPPRYA